MPNEESYLDRSLRKIAKGAGVGFFGIFLGMVFGYLSRIVIARFLGSYDYGLINLGFAIMTIASTFSMVGLSPGIQRYVSFYKGRGDEGRIKGTILGALRISFPLSLLFSIILFSGADWISVNVLHEPNLTPVLRIFAIAIPFLSLTNNLISGTIGFQDLRYRIYVNDLFQNIFKFILIISLLLLGFGVIGAAWGWVLAIISMPFLAFYFLETRVFSILNKKVKAIQMERELISFSLPLIFVGFAGLITGWTDTLMLGYFYTASDVGVYNAALPTARLITIVLESFGLIFMPVVSELYGRGKIEELDNTYSSVTKWIFTIAVPVFLLMILFSDFIIEIMFGSEYVIGVLALNILAFGYLVICIVGPTAQILQAYGRTKVLMGCNFVGAGANFVLNFLLIPAYGINGAAIATASSLALMNILHMVLIHRITGMQPFRVSYIKPLFSSTIAFGITYMIMKYLVSVTILSSILLFILFTVIYLFLLLLMRSFEEEDLMIMRVIDQRLGIKSDWVRDIIRRFL